MESQHRLATAVNWAKQRSRRFKGSVYVLECQGFTKIGTADNVALRLANLQTGNPHPITMVCKWESADPYSEEMQLHRQLRPYHIRGEWFKLPDETLADLILKSISNA